jgi:predicted Zn-dependent protease
LSFESNNLGFEVKKSVNKDDFEKTRFMSRQDTIAPPQNYVFEEKNIAATVYYYRLKQADFDDVISATLKLFELN